MGRRGARRSAVAWVSALLTCVALPSLGRSDDPEAPACLDQLAAFAEAQNIALDPARMTTGARWAGAGHELRQLPGLAARLPVRSCGGALVVDLSPACRIVKSRGEGGCKSIFPMRFH